MPRPIGYLVSAVVVIPLVTHGITLISRLQIVTQPLWLILHIAAVRRDRVRASPVVHRVDAFPGVHGAAATFRPAPVRRAAAVVFSLIAQIGEQVDYLRFLPRDRTNVEAGLVARDAGAGPGWMVLGAAQAAGRLVPRLFWRSSHGVTAEHAAEPTQMYLTAFEYVLSSAGLALALTGTFVIVSQLKINVTNAYAGSLAWSNFFSRLTHSHPGRVVWLVFNVLIAAAADGDRRLPGAGADPRPLLQRRDRLDRRAGRRPRDQQAARLAPAASEFKRAHLYDINPVGVGAMALAPLPSIRAFIGLFGPTLQAFSPFIALTWRSSPRPLIA